MKMSLAKNHDVQSGRGASVRAVILENSHVVREQDAFEFIRSAVKKEQIHSAPKIPGFRIENRKMQMRFHFRMDRCIGCHCCEVACAEQNGLPPEVQWRRVGEIEGGIFPDAKRYYLSSGCNHCLDAPCMKGCPVDAYQVNDRGIVEHLDNICIGCQYCTWNCPYGVPVYQEDRHIVTKCDMCVNRLDQKLDPACVEACPAGAILIEEVPVEDILHDYTADMSGPDMPPPGISIPSTKITFPPGMNMEEFRKSDLPYIRPENPHMPLVWMTVLTQLAAGSFIFSFLCDLLGHVYSGWFAAQSMAWLAPANSIIAGFSLAASTLHLGRPLYAYRAIKMWRTSWLSREVIALSMFAVIAVLYSSCVFFSQSTGLGFHNNIPASLRLTLGFLTLISGFAGVYASSKLYRVPSRPAWDSRKTTVDFFFVMLIAGPSLFVFAVAVSSQIFRADFSKLLEITHAATLVSTILAFVFCISLAAVMKQFENSPVLELRSTAHLYMKNFWRFRFIRNGMIVGASLCWYIFETRQVPLFSPAGVFASGVHLLLLTLYCLANRYLFFVTVVARNIPGNFLVAAHAATEGK